MIDNNVWFALSFIVIIVGILLMAITEREINAIKALLRYICVDIRFQIGCLIGLIGAIALFLLALMDISMF